MGFYGREALARLGNVGAGAGLFRLVRALQRVDKSAVERHPAGLPGSGRCTRNALSASANWSASASGAERRALLRIGWRLIEPSSVLREARPLGHEGVDRRGLVRIAGGEAADDEPVGSQAQELAQGVAIARHARLRAARKAF